MGLPCMFTAISTRTELRKFGNVEYFSDLAHVFLPLGAAWLAVGRCGFGNVDSLLFGHRPCVPPGDPSPTGTIPPPGAKFSERHYLSSS